MGERMLFRKVAVPVGRLAALLSLGCVSSGCAGRINDTVWRSFSDWSYSTAIGTAIHDSTWLFAIIESFHLVGLALVGGAILIVDMRLWGIGVREQSAAQLAREAQPVLLTGLVVMIASGVLLFLSEATKFYSEDFWGSAEFPFVYKMVFLILAMVFTYTVRRRILLAGETRVSQAWRRLVSATSMILWLAVGIGGRSIGFY